MYRNNKLAKSVRLALMFGAGATAFAGVASAQEQDEQAAERTERIQVTGSRLQRTDLETSSPLTVIGREDISAGGYANVGEILSTLNQADAVGLTNVTSDTNGNDGSQTISLRGLGTTRTLVLVDGRRWLALGGGQVDISQIPTAIIERIEVLADGASALYGSDAIAGVINIITRNDVEGAEVEARYSQYGEGDGENFEMSASIGARGERSSIFFNINKLEQKAIGAGEREISRTPDAGIPASVTGSAFGEYGYFYTPDGRYVHLDPDFDISGGARPTTDDFLEGSAAYNFAPQNYLLTPSERLSMFVKADYELTSNVRAFAQATYTQRKSRSEIAEVPLTMYFSGPQWEIPISGDNYYNPFGADIEGSGMRMSAAGPRTRVQDYDSYFMTGGLEGDFLLGNNSFSWDVSYSRGEASRHNQGTNYVNLQNLRDGLGPSFNDNGVITCGTPDSPISGCVPIDMFTGAAGMTPEMVEYMTYTQQDNTRTGTTNFSANIAGDLFELPAGYVSIAAGLEYRTDTYSRTPDALTVAGLSSDNFVEPTQGEQSANEYYVEVGVPVLRDLPAVESLDLNFAWRRSEFDNDGLVGVNPVQAEFDNDSFKVGATWRLNQELMIRGNYGETFRAPSVSNLYAGGSESFAATTDLCSNSAVVGDPYNNQLDSAQRTRCDTLTGVAGGVPQTTNQIRTLSGGNPNLQPESGETYTFGVVYNPTWFEGFDISVDWWKIELEGIMASIGGGTILEECIIDGIDASCGFIERTATGEAQTIRTGQQNLAFAEVEGIDVEANYSWETAEWGRFSLGARTTYNMSTAVAIGEDSELVNRIGNINGPFGGPAWRWRSNLGLTWAYNDWTANWSVRHMSSVTEACSAIMIDYDVCTNVDIILDADGAVEENNSFNSVGSTFYHDISVSYALPWDATVRVGGRNVFQKDPPRSYSAFANTFNQAYDIPGGRYFVSYRHRF